LNSLGDVDYYHDCVENITQFFENIEKSQNYKIVPSINSC